MSWFTVFGMDAGSVWSRYNYQSGDLMRLVNFHSLMNSTGSAIT